MEGLAAILAERLSPTDLQSLMLAVYRARAAQVSPSELLARYEMSRFARPADVDPRSAADFERRALSLLPDEYEPIELSPLCPIGTSSAVATVDQNKVVTTIRNMEVVADSTNVLALECASRRRRLLARPDTRFGRVLLHTSQRQTRAQVFGGPREMAHFRLLGLAAAGRDEGSFRFESEALVAQIGYLLHLSSSCRPAWRLEVALTDLADRTDLIEASIVVPLTRQYPGCVIRIDPTRQSGRGYYVDTWFKAFAHDESGEVLELADGGCTTWTRQLLSDEKERLVIAGLGVDRLLT